MQIHAYKSSLSRKKKGSNKLKNESPAHCRAEHCRTMTKCSSWYMKGIFVKLVMSFFKASEVVKALRWAEFRSVLEVTRWIERALLDFTEKSYSWASSVKKLKKRNNLFSPVLRTRQDSIQLSLHMLIPKQWYPQQTQKYLLSNFEEHNTWKTFS